MPYDLSAKGHLGPAVESTMTLVEGQCVTFVLRHLSPQATAHANASINPPDGVPVGVSGLSPNDPYLTKV